MKVGSLSIIKRKELDKYQVVLWDLDNTLYTENDFLFQAYNEFSAKYFAHNSKAFEFLKSTFLLEGRGGLVQKFAHKFNIDTGLEDLKGSFFTVMREGDFQLLLNPKIEECLGKLSRDHIRQGIITNGNVAQQENKIKSLGLLEKFPFLTIVYANEGEKKPSPWSYLEMKKRLSIKPDDKVLYIGDSDVDKIFAERAGIDFIFVQDIL